MRTERNSRWIQARYLLPSPHLFWGFWGQLYAHKLVVVKTTSADCVAGNMAVAASRS
jgi:hypothetical protein